MGWMPLQDRCQGLEQSCVFGGAEINKKNLLTRQPGVWQHDFARVPMLSFHQTCFVELTWCLRANIRPTISVSYNKSPIWQAVTVAVTQSLHRRAIVINAKLFAVERGRSRSENVRSKMLCATDVRLAFWSQRGEFPSTALNTLECRFIWPVYCLRTGLMHVLSTHRKIAHCIARMSQGIVHLIEVEAAVSAGLWRFIEIRGNHFASSKANQRNGFLI